MCWADAYCTRPGCTGCVCSGCGQRHHGAIGHGPPCSCPGALEAARKHSAILGEILTAASDERRQGLEAAMAVEDDLQGHVDKLHELLGIVGLDDKKT